MTELVKKRLMVAALLLIALGVGMDRPTVAAADTALVETVGRIAHCAAECLKPLKQCPWNTECI